MQHTDFLIVGAGPYGLSTAAYARSLGVDVTVVGKPLEAWTHNMPRGMFLRSLPDWHLDVREVATFQSFVDTRGLSFNDHHPVPRQTFLDYAQSFMAHYDVEPHTAYVTHLTRADGRYVATLDDGSQWSAQNVLLSLGFTFFKHCPDELAARLPIGSYVHTCDSVDLEVYRGQRVLIVGGRQSAFEWAALIREEGAEQVIITHRHPTPLFTESDWSWVLPMVRRTLDEHDWFRRSSSDDQERIRQDFFAAGRLKLEPWLATRVQQPNIHVREKTTIVSVEARIDGTYDVSLADASRWNVHRIILATGYLPVMSKVAFLDRTTIGDQLATANGFPTLGPEFQTNLPNLYVSGLAATRDFGPFFGFTVACPVAARIIGDAVCR